MLVTCRVATRSWSPPFAMVATATLPPSLVLTYMMHHTYDKGEDMHKLNCLRHIDILGQEKPLVATLWHSLPSLPREIPYRQQFQHRRFTTELVNCYCLQVHTRQTWPISCIKRYCKNIPISSDIAISSYASKIMQCNTKVQP